MCFYGTNGVYATAVYPPEGRWGRIPIESFPETNRLLFGNPLSSRGM